MADFENKLISKDQQKDFFASILIKEYIPTTLFINEEYEVVYSSGDVHKFFQFPRNQKTPNLLSALQPNTQTVVRTAVDELLNTQKHDVSTTVDLSTQSEEHKVKLHLRKIADSATDETFIRIQLANSSIPENQPSDNENATPHHTLVDLFEKNDRIKFIIDAVKLGYAEWDISNNKITCNSHYKEIFGMKDGNTVSFEDAYEKIHPEDLPKVKRAIDKALKDGAKFKFNYRIRRDDGSIRYVSGNATSVKDKGGEISRLIITINDVTRSRRAEQEALQYGRLLEESHNEIYLFDVETLKFININNEAKKNLGYKLDELRELTPLKLNPKLSSDQLQSLIEPLRSGEKDKITFETTFLRKNGTQYHVLLNLQLTKWNDQPTFVAIAQDITEIKQAEKEVIQYGKMLEQSHNEIYIFDAESLRFLNVNKGARRNLGYTLDELKELTPLDLKPQFTPEKFQEQIMPLYKEETEIVTFDTVHLRKDGSLYDVLVNLQLTELYGRKVFVAIIQDITPLMRALEKISRNEERLDFAIKGTSDGIWDWPDMSKDYVWWSDKHYEILGLSPGEVEPNVKSFNALVHPDDKTKWLDTLEEHIKEKSHFDLEIRIWHKTEGYRWYRARGRFMKGNNGLPNRMAGSLMDIHQQKKAELELKDANIKLKNANEYLDNFVYTAAHDLRAPVANMKSIIDLYEIDEEKSMFAKAINTSVNRLEDTLQSLIKILEIQQMEHSGALLLNFACIFEEVLAEFEEELNLIKPTIITNFKVESISYVEPFLRSILRNLLSNSIKYRKDDEPLHIMVDSIKDGEQILLKFQDNGIGINAVRFKDKVFKPFVRLTKKAEGKGVGMHLVKTMIEKNGGLVEVTGEEGVGTTFLLHLSPYK